MILIFLSFFISKSLIIEIQFFHKYYQNSHKYYLFVYLEHEWTWDKGNNTYTILLSENNLKVKFHNGHSYGTAVVRGTNILEKGRHHYWEVKMLSYIYGTDIVSIFNKK